MKKGLLLVLSMLFFASWSIAQERTVTGTVTSEDGLSIPGVNVVIKGSSGGTVTDVNGGYSIVVPADDAVLEFSFLGLASQEQPINGRSVIDVTMKSDVKQLNEVVVTGYQSQLKREFTGSVSSVDGKTIQDLPVQSFDRAIQGRVAGAQIAASSGQPGGALNIRVRGFSSINAGNEPLIIIDGVQVSDVGGTTQGSYNPLNQINPNDIASMDVLKDAAATAIYGAQAANGVIIVTTKKGSSVGETQVNLSVQEGFVQPMNLYNLLDGPQYAMLQAEANRNTGIDPTAPNGAYTLFGNPETDTVQNYNWKDAMFRDARLRTYDLSVIGGDERTSFYFGGSYNYQEGQVIMSDWERFTGRLNVSHRVTDKLQLDARLSVNHNKTFGSIANGNFVNGPFVGAFSSIPTSPAVDEDGNYNLYPINGPSGHLFGYNILQGVNEEVRLGRTFGTISSFSTTYQILPELSASGFIGVDFSMNRDDNQRPSSIPAFASNGGSVFVNNRRSFNYNYNFNLNYNKNFGQYHSFGAFVGYEYKAEQREGNNLTANQFSNPFFRLPGQGQPFATGGFFQDYKRLGVFGKIDYDYDDKYIAGFTLRRDGHSRFGDKNKYGTFYAGSVGWRISAENFMSGINFVDDLKLKASYGITGNAEIDNYATVTGYSTPTQAQYVGSSLLRISRLGNDEITWEEESQLSIGLDFSVFNNRFYGSIEAWQTNNTELLFDVPFLQSGGVRNNEIVANVGELLNQGIDVDFNAVILDQGGFRWSSRFNVGFLRNEVTGLPANQDTIRDSESGIPTLIVGEPLDFYYLLDYAGVNPANGRAMVRSADGELLYNPTLEHAGVRGTAIPDYFGGFENTFAYKGVTLNVFFQYQMGNEAFNADLYNLDASGSGSDNQRTTQLERWQEPGDLTNVPQATTNGIIAGINQQFGFVGSTRYMSDASYIRLKQVTLSYDFPQNLMSSIGLRNARIFVQGMNLLTWTNFDGIDPEVIVDNNLTNESSVGTYPLGRQFSAGINLGL